MLVKMLNCGVTAGCIEIRVPRSKCKQTQFLLNKTFILGNFFLKFAQFVGIS